MSSLLARQVQPLSPHLASPRQSMGSFFSSPVSAEAMSSAKQFVDQTLRNGRVVVFSKTYCPYCHKAKRALKNHLPEAKITIIELDQRSDGSAIQQCLGELTGATSVPRVFVDGEFIGGGDQTEALDRSGKLEVMLREKGIL